MFGFGKRRPTAGPDTSAIVPRIKHANFLRAARDQGVPPDPMPRTEPLVADLIVAYAFDLPGMFRMVSPVDLERLAIDPAALRDLSVRNLKRQVKQIGIVEEPRWKRVVTGDELEACVLLADSFWDDLAAEIPGGLVVAVPHRSEVLFGPAGSEALPARMRARAAEVRRADPVHCLTDQLLTRKGGAWAKFAG